MAPKRGNFEVWLTDNLAKPGPLSSADGALRVLAQNMHCERYAYLGAESGSLVSNGAEGYTIGSRRDPHWWRCRGCELVFEAAPRNRVQKTLENMTAPFAGSYCGSPIPGSGREAMGCGLVPTTPMSLAGTQSFNNCVSAQPAPCAHVLAAFLREYTRGTQPVRGTTGSGCEVNDVLVYGLGRQQAGRQWRRFIDHSELSTQSVKLVLVQGPGHRTSRLPILLVFRPRPLRGCASHSLWTR